MLRNRTRLAVVCSHPIQYHAPLYRELAGRTDLHVFFAYRATPKDQAAAGFGVDFDWDIDPLSGYAHSFLENVSPQAGLGFFGGCDTPTVCNRLEEQPFDALLLMGWHLKTYVQALLAAKIRGLPVMVRGDSQLQTARSLPKRILKAFGYPAFLRLFDVALYVGERSRAYYERYHYPGRRLFFSPHCVDNTWFADRSTEAARQELRDRLGVGAKDKLVLFAGKLLPFKRPLDLVDACAAIRLRGLPLGILVAGSGVLEPDLRQRAAAFGVPLYLLGFCNQTQMPAAYAAADALALPSSSETWGLVANEALACGRPIVISDACGCAPDLVGDGTVGRRFPVGDVQTLADALFCVLNERPTREQFTQKLIVYGPARAAEGVCQALGSLLGR